MLININEAQNKQVEEFLDEGLLKFKQNMNYQLKISEKEGEQKKYQNFINAENEKIIEKNINNNIKNLNSEYITYKGISTELINNTIQALNTGLYFLNTKQIKRNKIKYNQSKDKTRKFNNSIKKAPKNYKTFNKRIEKNSIKKKINLKKKLINKPAIKNIKLKKRNKSFDVNRKSINTLSIQRNNEINYSSIFQNNSTNDNSIKTNKLNKIIKKENKDFVDSKYTTIKPNIVFKNNNSKKSMNTFESIEKYETLNSELENTLKKIKILKIGNKNYEIRLENVKNKSINMKKIRNKNKTNEMNLNRLKKDFDYSESIKMKQINLMNKISSEIENLKILSNSKNNYN